MQERRRGVGLAAGEATAASSGATPRFVELRLPGTPPVPPSPIAAKLSVTLRDGVVLRGADDHNDRLTYDSAVIVVATGS